MKNLIITCLICVATASFGQNQPPEISNVNLILNGNETLTIQYDLLDLENDAVNISLRIRNSDGITSSINTQNASGDIDMVNPGIGKSIEWDYAGILTTSDDYIIKLVAEDMTMIDIQSIVNQVDSNNLKMDLEMIEGIRHRNTGPDHLQATRDLIDQRFSDYGLNATIQDFDFGAYIGKNHIGTKNGTTDDALIYICDAHYDGVSNGPGADDNGSGVAGILEAARVLSNYNFKKTIKFIGFDLEEAGLKGSEAYVLNNISAEEEIAGVLNFEMIGYYTEAPNTQIFPTGFNILFPNEYAIVENNDFKGDFIANIGVEGQNDWELIYENAAATYVPDLKVITFTAPDNWLFIAPDLGRSDHAPFWLSDRPAVMLTGTAEFRNPDYHTVNDTSGVLNYTFMSNVVKAAVATLAEEAGVHNSSFVEETINIMVNSTEDINSCDFYLSPNPAHEALIFDTQNCPSYFEKVTIYDLNGKVIFNQEDIYAGLELDISSWANGIYILKADQFLERFIVQH